MKTDVLIVGAGFAGASTAYHLSRFFKGSILIVEREAIPGAHASGRNASLILQSTEIASIRRAVALSRRFYDANSQETGFHPVGSLLLGKREQLEKVRQPRLIASEFWDHADVCRKIPLLHGHRFEAALWTPSDAVIDIAALLQFYLREARARGVKLWVECSVHDIVKADRFRIETSIGPVEASHVINAAGAWAPDVGRMAGAAPIPLTPWKRHLFVLDAGSAILPGLPFVWNVEQNFYFRPEGGGLLFSICDEERSENLEETVSPEIALGLADVICREFPDLSEALLKRVWSCFRTKSADGSFVIGWDPNLEGFFWVAGLGGHGVGASWRAGRLAAEKFTGRVESAGCPFDPSRFQIPHLTNPA